MDILINIFIATIFGIIAIFIAEYILSFLPLTLFSVLVAIICGILFIFLALYTLRKRFRIKVDSFFNELFQLIRAGFKKKKLYKKKIKKLSQYQKCVLEYIFKNYPITMAELSKNVGSHSSHSPDNFVEALNLLKDEGFIHWKSKLKFPTIIKALKDALKYLKKVKIKNEG